MIHSPEEFFQPVSGPSVQRAFMFSTSPAQPDAISAPSEL